MLCDGKDHCKYRINVAKPVCGNQMKPTTLRLLKASVNKQPFFPTNQLWDINTFLQDHNQWEEWSNRESWVVGLWFGISQMTVKKDKDNFIVISTARHLTRNTISYYTSQLMINPELMINLSTVTRHSPQNVIWSSILRLTAEEIKNSNAPNVIRHLQQNIVWFIISRDTVVRKNSNVSSVTNHIQGNILSPSILKSTMENNYFNADCATKTFHRNIIWLSVTEDTVVWKNFNVITVTKHLW